MSASDCVKGIPSFFQNSSEVVCTHRATAARGPCRRCRHQSRLPWCPRFSAFQPLDCLQNLTAAWPPQLDLQQRVTHFFVSPSPKLAKYKIKLSPACSVSNLPLLNSLRRAELKSHTCWLLQVLHSHFFSSSGS